MNHAQILLKSSFASEKPTHTEKRVTKKEKPKEVRLQKAEKKFDYWVKAYDHHGEKRHDILLLRWLTADSGAKLVHNYEEFTELDRGEYDISKVPLKAQFEKAMPEIKHSIFETTSSSEKSNHTERDITKNEKPKEERLLKAEKDFDYWMKAYNHPGNRTHAENLLVWLTVGSETKLIQSYEEFVELANKLNSGEYDISKIPLKAQFEKAMPEIKHSAPETRGQRLAPKGERIQKSMEKFDYWMKHYNGHHGTHAEELLEWLYCDSGAEVITTYEEFTELVNGLNRGEYDLSIVPPQEQFEKSIEIYRRKVEKRSRRY